MVDVVIVYRRVIINECKFKTKTYAFVIKYEKESDKLAEI
jgi:hypothetical protein